MIQFDGQPWAPTAYTRPLRGDELVDSDGPRLVELLERHWTLPDGHLVRYDEPQKAWFNHILERYPSDWPVPALRGRLRYRQAVGSEGRQNGKSLKAGGLAVYGLTQHVPAPSVVGIATSVEQANVVYRRVKFAVDHSPLLSGLLHASGTRGIRWRDERGAYAVYPSKADGLQSVPVTLGIADELHLMRREMWYSIVNGQRAQADALVVGITTAGDDLSELLKELYQRGYQAIADPAADERFGFFCWEAPTGSTIHTPGALEAANPSVACGRVSRETVLADIAASPLTDQQRYGLNQFVAASKTWADLELWDQCPTTGVLDPAVIGVARSAGWEYVTLTAAAKDPDTGLVGTQTIASLRGCDRDALIVLLHRLLAAFPEVTIALDSRSLSDVGKHLRDDGAAVWLLTQTEQAQASAGVYARITAGTLAHDHHSLVRRQLATSRQARRPDGTWTITADAVPADAFLALVAAAHVADVQPAPTSQIF